MTLPAHFRGLPGMLAAILAAGLCVCGGAAAEEDFRIENKVFVDDEKEPRIQSTTIFHEGVVYDYLADPAEVTVFDARHRRFVLLDLTRRIKTELTTERVVDFSQRLKEWAEGQSDEFLQFLANPQFEEEFDESTQELNFTSPWMTYRMTTIGTESEEISGQYREFADWYCRLNTVLNPGARPPFARMKVNAALLERQQFPREVELTIQPKESFLAKRLTVRSEHLLIRQLVESDRKRVAQTDQFLAMYTTVDFDEYQRKMAN
ncbi:MAG: hypothetical protein ABIK89_19240 [Planctomycetota bacterium]